MGREKSCKNGMLYTNARRRIVNKEQYKRGVNNDGRPETKKRS